MKNLEIKLANGATLTGSPEQVAEFLKLTGTDPSADGKYYLSASKGLVEVAKMEATHLKNALLKKLRLRYESLVKETDLAKIVASVSDVTDDKLIVNMLFHLHQHSLKPVVKAPAPKV